MGLLEDAANLFRPAGSTDLGLTASDAFSTARATDVIGDPDQTASIVESWQAVAAVPDRWLGQLDESVARQFDSTPGGGFFDETVSQVRNLGPGWLDEAAGVAVLLGVVAVLAWLLRPFAQVAGGGS